MRLKKRVRVGGLDLAAANSGMFIAEAVTRNGQPPLEITPINAKALRTEMGDYTTRVKVSQEIVDAMLKHKVDFVVIEDYAMRMGPNNTSGLQQAELVGMVKLRLHEAGVVFMTVNPSQMRSFIGLMQKDKKQVIIDNMANRWGISSDAPRKADRSNIIDSAAHMIIGACVYFSSHGHLTSNLSERERRVLYGDDLKMQGLINKLPKKEK